MHDTIRTDNVYEVQNNRTASFNNFPQSDLGLSPSGSFSLKPRSITRWLVVTGSVVIIASIVVGICNGMSDYASPVFTRLNKVFSLDIKMNVPSFLKVLLFLLSSGTLAFISWFRRKQGFSFLHWAVLSAGFFYMAFDEMAVVHQRLVEPVRSLLGGHQLGVLHFAWVVPGTLIVLILGGAFLRFWWNLPRKTRLYMFIAGFLFVGGALGMEMIDGRYAELHGENNLTYMWMTTLEESMEIGGLIIFIKTILEYIVDSNPKIELRLGGSKNE